MPSSMGTGSDTRMYAPRSESMLGWSKDDDDYRHGIGDPETMERMRDKKMKEKESEGTVSELPHLTIESPNPEPSPSPEMPPMMDDEEEEEANPMADQYQEGNQLSAMTGMPDMGNLSIGNATGTKPDAGGQLVNMSEPMDDAWSSLLKEEGEEEEEDDAVPDPRKKFKLTPEEMVQAYRDRAQVLGGGNVAEMRETGGEFNAPPNEDTYFTTGEPINDAWSTLMKTIDRLDKVKGGDSVQPWQQSKFEIQPGGADISTATSRRSKLHSRFLQPTKKRGLMRSPLSVHMSHLGVATKQPLKLFPSKYGQQMGSMGRRKWQGNIPTVAAGHAMGPETTYSPKAPSVASGEGLKIKEPRAPKMTGSSFAKSDNLEAIKKDIEAVKKKMDYMHFAQIRRLLRRLKDATERQERRLKASSGVGEINEAGHREGQDGTTSPEGATENLNSEDDPKNWGATGRLFVAPGSGRVG